MLLTWIEMYILDWVGLKWYYCSYWVILYELRSVGGNGNSQYWAEMAEFLKLMIEKNYVGL
jgi:hypothetical protein